MTPAAGTYQVQVEPAGSGNDQHDRRGERADPDNALGSFASDGDTAAFAGN